MKKQLLLPLALLLSAPIAFAQVGSVTDPDDDKEASTPTDTVPGSATINPDDDGASGSAGAGDNRARGSAEADEGKGRASSRSSEQSDFGGYDANGDGKLSREELRTNATLGSQFEEMDRNSDGTLSRIEYSSGLKARPTEDGAKARSESRTEGSDRSDEDDSLDRRLGGG